MSIFTGLFASATSKIAVVAVVIAFAAGIFVGWHEESARIPAKLQAQVDADAGACAKNEKITKEAYDAIISNKDRANSACAAALSMRSTCVPVHADGANSVAGAQRKPDDSGLESRWLRAYESTCKLIQADYHAVVDHDKKCVSTLNGDH